MAYTIAIDHVELEEILGSLRHRAQVIGDATRWDREQQEWLLRLVTKLDFQANPGLQPKGAANDRP